MIKRLLNMIRFPMHKFVRWANSYNQDEHPAYEISSTKLNRSDNLRIEGLNFTLMPATGGVIVQSRVYDEKHDRNTFNTYIIRDDEDIAQSIGHIVSMELLKVSL